MNFAEYNVKDANLEEVLLALKSLDTVEAVALGGSRSTGASDENSDYDIYVYCAEIPTAETRENLLGKYCSIAEFGNHYWESEDNTVMNNGVPVDIIYREVDRFGRYIDTVIKGGKAFNGYTTAFWHNIKNSKVLFDKTGNFTKFRDMAQIDFPENLRSAIIKNNRNLLNGKLPLCKKYCTLLPKDFEENINALMKSISDGGSYEIVTAMVNNLDEILNDEFK